jgi:hypothetical protein
MGEHSMSEHELFNSAKEREDIYRKLKDAFDFLASIIIDEEASVIQRIRATKTLSETAKTMRSYIRDEERLDELARKIKKIKKQIASKRRNTN